MNGAERLDQVMDSLKRILDNNNFKCNDCGNFNSSYDPWEKDLQGFPCRCSNCFSKNITYVHEKKIIPHKKKTIRVDKWNVGLEKRDKVEIQLDKILFVREEEGRNLADICLGKNFSIGVHLCSYRKAMKKLEDKND
jgi:hypothetical protein